MSDPSEKLLDAMSLLEELAREVTPEEAVDAIDAAHTAILLARVAPHGGMGRSPLATPQSGSRHSLTAGRRQRLRRDRRLGLTWLRCARS